MNVAAKNVYRDDNIRQKILFHKRPTAFEQNINSIFHIFAKKFPLAVKLFRFSTIPTAPTGVITCFVS